MIAQLILQVTSVASRAFVSAYQQALQNAKAGGGGGASAAAGSAAMKSAMSKTKMQSDEALKILNIERSALSRPVLEEQYKKFFSQNDPKKGGSFYLQSKIFRAKEALDASLASPDEPEEHAPPANGPAVKEESPGGREKEGGNRFDRFKRG